MRSSGWGPGLVGLVPLSEETPELTLLSSFFLPSFLFLNDIYSHHFQKIKINGDLENKTVYIMVSLLLWKVSIAMIKYVSISFLFKSSFISEI